MDWHAPTTMTPREFIKRWKDSALNERQSAQSHFRDLCAVFGHVDPIADPTGDAFAFEKGVSKTGGGNGFADVWKAGHFALEYKKKRHNLDDALKQLSQYAMALDNPPLHVACDTDRFKIVTAWTNTVPRVFNISLDDLVDPDKFAILHAVFHDPESLKPAQTRQQLTRTAADKFSTLALRMQGRGTVEAVAHFINQLAFCYFANSVRLLPEGLWRRLLERASAKPDRAKPMLDRLFAAMEVPGGELDFIEIAHFNGGLFDGRRALPLDQGDVDLLWSLYRGKDQQGRYTDLDWGQIDPTIFGTLFERFLDPDKRAQIGAHYTDEAKIMLIVEPVLIRPLRSEWSAAKARIAGFLDGSIAPPTVVAGAAGGVKASGKPSRRKLTPIQAAEEERARFLERLRTLTILDPACGSGNFLYLALQAVKDLELLANAQCEEFGLQRSLPQVGPEILHGLEINPLAAELARTTIWIGDIQWGIRNGFYNRPEPILRKLDSIECRDALIDWGQDGATPIEAQWPPAEFIIGNPPFLGGKKLRAGLGDDYVSSLFGIFDGKVPREADLVMYWFEKALHQIATGQTKRAGLVSTNSIRGGANRKVVERMIADAPVFDAWADEPWILNGAAVRVSMVCFGARDDGEGLALDGLPVTAINSDLTALAADLTLAKRLKENVGVAFIGIQKTGPFDIRPTIARSWLQEPLNPNARPNADLPVSERR